jgi:hypothetical protein
VKEENEKQKAQKHNSKQAPPAKPKAQKSHEAGEEKGKRSIEKDKGTVTERADERKMVDLCAEQLSPNKQLRCCEAESARAK